MRVLGQRRVALHDGMAAAEARAEGYPVPATVPQVAKLRFRKHRTGKMIGEGGHSRYPVESLWAWRWEMAHNVGPDGACSSTSTTTTTINCLPSCAGPSPLTTR
jgi:hypothetical protein